MNSDNNDDDVQKALEHIEEFHDQPYWKQVASTTLAMSYLVATRIFIPALVALGVVEVLTWAF